MGAWTLVEQLGLDLRYALRMMRTAKALTALAVLTLTLGIGANTAIFSLINALMVRPLPVRAPEELVELLSQFPGDFRMNGFGWRFYEHYRDYNTTFADVIGVTGISRFRVGHDGVEADSAEGEAEGQYVTGNFFSALGVSPAFGRLIGPHEDRVGATDAAAVVLSWSYWSSSFHRDPTIVGKPIVVDGVPATVMGVARPEFFGIVVGVRPNLWLPIAMAPTIARASGRANAPTGLDQMGVGIMARLKPGVSMAQALAEMRVLDRWRVEELAKTSTNPQVRQLKIEMASASTGLSAIREKWTTPLLALMIVVALVLLLACINVATMLLARSASRQREMAVRVSLGAGRLRLVRQMLTESLLLSSVSSVLGILVAYAGADALVRIVASGPQGPGRGFPMHIEIDVQPDAHVLLFTAGVAVLTGVLFGMAPAWSAFRTAPGAFLRHAGETWSRRLLGRSLVVAQVVLSMMLLSAAGLFVGHLSNLRNVEAGFQRDSVLLVTLDPAGSGYNRQQLSVLYQELLVRLEGISGVRTATLSGIIPISGAGWSRLVQVEGFQEEPANRRYISLNAIAPKYFATYGTPLLAGREFQFEDAGRPRVAIINRAMAHYYFGNSNPIGRHVTIDGDGAPYEIIGVVETAKYTDLHEAAPRTMYLHAFQDGRIGSQFALRTAVAPAAVAADVQRTVRELLKTVKVGKVTTLADQVDASVVPERLLAGLSGLFGVLGVVLAAIGLYGLLAYTVARRVHEIGVRMALGATREDVTRMVLKSAFGLVSAGLVVGIPLALVSKRVAANAMGNVSVDSTFPIIVAAAAMVAVALIAAYVPARRAARVEPREALRQD